MDDARKVQLTQALHRTASGDSRAFRLVYKLTSAKLFGICLHVCGERKAAEDVLQDVFLTVWSRADGFDATRGSAITWLATIARNRAIDWRRANCRPSEQADALEEIVDPALLPSDMLLLDEREHMLQICLEALEMNERSAIRTAFFDGLSYAELAERVSVPLGTMKSRIRRGLMRLRECLDGPDC